MKWTDYKIEGWKDFSVKKELQFNKFKVLLLSIGYLDSPPVEGRKNLIAINDENDIIWIANIPISHSLYGFYDAIEKNGDFLLAWCGSIYCEIEPATGNILKEMFVK